MYTKYPKGSEWRKWDLHVHTPASPLNNQFGNDWDMYIKNLFTKAIENNIKVIGITDYFSIEGYKKILTYLDDRPHLQEIFQDKPAGFVDQIYNITLLPNIEFRLNKTIILERSKDGNIDHKRLNFHIIFASREEISITDIEECFLHDLKFIYESAPQTPEDKRPLKMRNLEELGQKLRAEHAHFRVHTNLEVGMMTAVVDDSDIIDLLQRQKSKFNGKYIAILAEDRLSLMDWNGQDHNTRKLLYQKSDAVFSANPNTIDWCLGKRHGSSEEFIAEFKSFKPCLFGSDAHEYEKLFKPEGNKYCWIKANPTFEGLKQTIYEPFDRIRLQENEPYRKEPYLYIEKVQFEDGGKNIFDNKGIDINKYLNTIIGGKSAGKSLLLYQIANAVDPEQVKEKSTIVRVDDYKDIGEYGFDVTWGDGYVDSNGTTEKKRKVTYLPQMFISAIAENQVKLNDWIENLILDNETIKEKYSQYYDIILETRRNIGYIINDYIEKLVNYNKHKAELGEKGDKEAIIKDIESINGSINELQKNSALTPEEIGLYDEQNKKKIGLINITNTINILLDRLEGLERYFLSLLQSTKAERIGCYEDVAFALELLEDFEEGKKSINDIIDDYDEAMIGNINDAMSKTQAAKSMWEEKRVVLNNEITYIITALKPLEDKIQNRQLLDELNKRIEKQLLVLAEYNKFDRELQTEYKVLGVAKSNLLAEYGKIKGLYDNLKNEVLSECKVGGNIDICVDIIFENDRFNGTFVELLSKKYNLNNKLCDCFDNKNNYQYNEAKHIENIVIIFNKIITGELSDVFKTGIELKKAVHNLFDDYYYIKYDLKQNGEELKRMSPGKRGLILLKLYIDRTNGIHPILIDQPEENLDNRTIYKELKEFIKDKKIERQIIIVTHNSNLVVNTDAENIIVANQSDTENRKCRFEYVTGALEHTFKEKIDEGILYSQGIREHICEILEGGKEAFEKREQKYGF